MSTVADDELELPPSPDAVPLARRHARRVLAGQPDDLAGDVELVVSELVANAALHGAPPLRLRLREVAPGRVRVEVHDGGRAVPVRVRAGDSAMTGRGLGMVAALAVGWGVDAADGAGKVVWADVDAAAAGGSPGGSAGQVDADAILAAWPDDDGVARHSVALGSVSTELLLSAKAHIDNVVRELTLLRDGGASGGIPPGPEVVALIEAVTVDFAEARAEIKRQAAGAAARGEAVTDLVLRLPEGAAEAGERYLEALDEADRFARSARLLTLAPPRAHRVLRRWYVGAIVAGLRAAAAGEAAPEPEPLQAVLAREVDALEVQAGASARLALLQEVTAALAAADGAAAMAAIATDHAVALPGVTSAKVRLLQPDGVLHPVGWASRDDAGPGPDYAIGDDLPGSVAVRERRPVSIRELDRALAGDPRFRGRYPAGRSAHVVPLVAGEEVLGTLSLTFQRGELSDQGELSLVRSLGDVLAQALARDRLLQVGGRPRGGRPVGGAAPRRRIQGRRRR